jgi:hypothetical protein
LGLLKKEAMRAVTDSHPVDADGDGWADVIDTLTMHPDTRRKVVRLLAEIDAGGGERRSL